MKNPNERDEGKGCSNSDPSWAIMVSRFEGLLNIPRTRIQVRGRSYAKFRRQMVILTPRSTTFVVNGYAHPPLELERPGFRPPTPFNPDCTGKANDLPSPSGRPPFCGVFCGSSGPTGRERFRTGHGEDMAANPATGQKSLTKSCDNAHVLKPGPARFWNPRKSHFFPQSI